MRLTCPHGASPKVVGDFDQSPPLIRRRKRGGSIYEHVDLDARMAPQQ
jgi:hypothetical protein